MAGEDLDLDESGADGGKKGKHKPLTKGQKIGIGIGLATILLIIYQVKKQSAANASTSASSSAIDPLTGYPTGSAQDQAALSSMYSGSASTGSYPGSGGGGGYYGGGTTTTDTSGSDLATYLESLPSSNPLSPNYTGASSTSPATTPSITVNVPAPEVTTTPAATTAAQGGASTTHDSTPPAANSLLAIVNAIDPNHTTVTVGGKTYYGIGNNPALTSISTAAHQQGVTYTQTNAQALGLPGGKATAQYIG